MKKTMYYVMSFIIVPTSVLFGEFLGYINLIQYLPTIYLSALFFTALIMGSLTPTHRKFDYIMTAIMPLSFVFAMFIFGFLGVEGLTPRFSLSVALDHALHPYSLQYGFMAGIITFIASFEQIRIVRMIKQKRTIYYVIPFVIFTALCLIITFLEYRISKQMSQHMFNALLLIIPVMIGNLSPTRRTFDYMMTVIMPLSFLCFMFIGGFLARDDMGTRYHLYKAYDVAFQPFVFRYGFMMGIVTFIASFKPIRIVRIIKQIKQFITNLKMKGKVVKV